MTSQRQSHSAKGVTLYLIRKDVELFLGPMTIRELKANMDRMAVGIRDEVSGSCGPWVYLDRQDLLNRHYPELVSLVQETTTDGWISDSGPFRNEPTAKGLMVSPGARPSRRRWFTGIFFGSALLFGVMLWLLTRGGELSSRIVGDKLPDVSMVEVQLANGDESRFVALMAPNIAEIIDRANRNQTAMDMWLPSLRAWSFWVGPLSQQVGTGALPAIEGYAAGRGEIDAVAAKKLRGLAGVAAPADCSLAAWRQRFTDALPSIELLDSGRQLPSDHWGRLLAWDPHWIRRRTQVGWKRPANFYHACLRSARNALSGLSVAPARQQAIASVRDRLDLIHALVSGEAITPSLRKVRGDSVFGLWSCMDLSTNRLELDRCLGREWESMMESDYNRERFYWSMVRMAMAAWRRGDNTGWQQIRNDLQSFLVGRDPSDTYTRFDYAGELGSIRAAGGSLPERIMTGPGAVPVTRGSGQEIEVDISH